MGSGQCRGNMTYAAISPRGKQSHFRKAFIPTLAAPNFPYVYVLFVDSGNLTYDTVSGDWFSTFRKIVVRASLRVIAG